MTQLATLQRISDLVEEYNTKQQAIGENITIYNKACDAMTMALERSD